MVHPVIPLLGEVRGETTDIDLSVKQYDRIERTDVKHRVMSLFSPCLVRGQALKATEATHVVDMCSGGGGPHRLLIPALQEYTKGPPIKMTLTDLYPNIEAWKEVWYSIPSSLW